MAFVSLLLVGFLVFLAGNGVSCNYDNGGAVMEEEELFGLFEVVGSLLDEPTWAQNHPLPCTDTPWPGVECELLEQDEETTIFHVTKIHVGPDIVTPPCKNSADISLSLLKLPYLKTLSLINCFTYKPVFLSQSLFGTLSSLEHLSLHSNPSLSGQIPRTISSLEKLQILCLSQNNLSGQIPKEIGKLVNLQQLDLSHNNLSGPIPEEIGTLENLAILDISWNLLQGTVPVSVGQLQSVEKIDLSSNKLRGKLPPNFGRLKRLVLMDLSHNSLTGPIPENLSGLHQLQYLIIEDNPLNSGFPSFLGSLTKLTVLSFSGCGLTGPIPNALSALTNLTALSLDDNFLNGTVPSELGMLPNIDTLNLSRNQLTGELLFPQDFVNRLGSRLDIRENKGLCTSNQGVQDSVTSSRFLQNPTCSSDAMFSAARNKTMAEKDPNPNPDRGENVKPGMYSKAQDSDKKIVPFSGLLTLLLLLLLFGS